MAEIKISDLSIGDWVRHTFYEENLQIKRIDGESERLLVEKGLMSVSCHLDHFEPIPLTPEILEKNGFEKNDDIKYTLHIKQGELRYRMYYSVFENNHHRAKNLKHQMSHFSIDEYTTGNWICIKRNQGKPLYLHEVQHALRLAGVEKEIEV